MAEEQLVVTSSPKKKIGFFSAILVVLGSTIGVGIFLRSKSVLENSANNIVWAIIVWLIAGFTVITMALALVEVASGRNDNLGMIGWTKTFSTLYIYKGNKFFMTYLYLPLTYFFMPYYVIVQFQDGISGFGGNIGFGGSTAAPWIYFAIGLALTVWMIFSAGISGRAGNIQNWIITSVKFIPIVAIIVIGIVFTVINTKAEGASAVWTPVTASSLFNKAETKFLGLSPFLGVFAALGGIFFAFDGFYVTAGMQSEMKNPEKTPAALVIGLLSMTILYIVIATAMTLGGKGGGFYDFGSLLSKRNAGWVFGVINIMISIGVLGILNGFSVWATRFVEDLIKEGEIFVPVKAYRYLKHAKMPIVGALFCLIISLPFMIIFTAIGAYAYIGGGYDTSYGYKIDNLLTFSDLMANWLAVFAFAYICAAIIGAIQNRKKHFVAVQENKHTIWAGYTSVIIILVTMFFLVIDPFISTGIAAVRYAKGDLSVKQALIGYAAASVLFIFYAIVMFASTPIEKAIAVANKKKYDRVLSGNICLCEKPDWCPCALADLREKAELNDLVLATYAQAR